MQSEIEMSIGSEYWGVPLPSQMGGSDGGQMVASQRDRVRWGPG